MNVNIYIDTSIRGPARKNGENGYILQAGNTDITKTVIGPVKDVTANEAILICLDKALDQIRSGCDKVYIHTNSNYVYLNCSVSRQIQWLESGYRTSKGEEVKYSTLWRQIHRKLDGKEFEVVYNQPNEFKNWLKAEVERRAKEHGF